MMIMYGNDVQQKACKIQKYAQLSDVVKWDICNAILQLFV